MTNAERQARWRKKHALPVPEWLRDIPEIQATLSVEDVFSYSDDPVMRQLLMDEVALLEAEVEADGVGGFQKCRSGRSEASYRRCQS
jgi:hypothetical protein